MGFCRFSLLPPPNTAVLVGYLQRAAVVAFLRRAVEGVFHMLEQPGVSGKCSDSQFIGGRWWWWGFFLLTPPTHPPPPCSAVQTMQRARHEGL